MSTSTVVCGRARCALAIAGAALALVLGAPAAVSARDGGEQIDGAATALLAPERIAALPAPEREAWTRYLATSERLRAADHAAIDAELRAAGKPRMTPAPYKKSFRFDPAVMTPTWLRSDEGHRMTEAVLSYQTPSGGWSKHVDLTARPRQPGESYYSENAGWQYIATIDNDSTTEELRFVAAALAVTSDPRLRASFDRGIGYLLTAQFPNGGWPQVFPLQGGYHDALTYNDDAIVNVMRLLGDVAAGRLGAPSPETRRAASGAVTRGLASIVATQVVEGGARTVWAQQHDPLTLAPAPARSYELAGLCGKESATVTTYLMSLPTPDAAVVEAVHAAVAWFRAHQVMGYNYDFKTGLTPAAGAGPIWARLYELGTGKPIMSNRDGIKRYDWNQLTDRRTGYAWYSIQPAGVLAAYEAWGHDHPRSRPRAHGRGAANPAPRAPSLP
jgi:PelA/Pel-15E family pectate lyase